MNILKIIIYLFIGNSFFTKKCIDYISNNEKNTVIDVEIKKNIKKIYCFEMKDFINKNYIEPVYFYVANETKYIIIYDKIQEQYDICINNQIKLRNDLYFSLSCNIIHNGKFIGNTSSININTLREQRDTGSKLYRTIRENGGWENFNIEIIGIHNCDKELSKKCEQYYIDLYCKDLHIFEKLNSINSYTTINMYKDRLEKCISLYYNDKVIREMNSISINIESKPNNMNISYFLLKNINKNYIDKNEYKPIICTENNKIIKLNGNINGVILSKNSENITEKDIEKYINDKRKSILKFINENNYNMVVDIYKGFKENLCPFIGRINFYNRLEF